jgi:pimeloyl-ACP methyl ester carboxylesterase
MLPHFLRALALWLTLFELLAGLRRWHGLSWLGRRFPRALLLVLLSAQARGLRSRRLSVQAPERRFFGGASPLQTSPPSALSSLLSALVWAALPALALQLAAGSLRNRALDPLARLRPGHHGDRTVERLDIPMAEGHCPALHVVPAGGARAAVLVLHGSGCDKTYFAWRLADALLARGLAALLVDLDGHGDSPRPQRFPGATHAAEAATGWLRGRYARVGLLGVSLGGCVAARAVADGLAADALALLETPPLLQFAPADRRREARALLQPFMFDLFGEANIYTLGRAVYDLVKAQRAARIVAEISTWDLIARLDLLASLPKIIAPLLLVYGGRDAIVPPAQAAQVRQASPRARFIMVPEASHLTLILHPGALSETASWLAEVLNAER